MRDNIRYCRKDGRIFQILDGFTEKPIDFESAKNKYNKNDYDRLEINQTIACFSDTHPIYSILKRIN